MKDCYQIVHRIVFVGSISVWYQRKSPLPFPGIQSNLCYINESLQSKNQCSSNIVLVHCDSIFKRIIIYPDNFVCNKMWSFWQIRYINVNVNVWFIVLIQVFDLTTLQFTPGHRHILIYISFSTPRGAYHTGCIRHCCCLCTLITDLYL